MKGFIVFTLLIAAALAAPATDDFVPFVVGGQNASPGQFPYIVSVQWVILGLPSHVCGGIIIGPSWVLSAAHCDTETPNVGRLTIIAGRHNINVAETDGQVREIDYTVLHPGWVPGPQVGPDDLKLLHLASPLTFNTRVRRAFLPAPHAIPTGPATLAGWGSTGGVLPPAILQHTTKPMISLTECRNAINAMGFDGNLVDNTNVCTGPLTGGVAACSGDSGGPLVQGVAPNEVVVGVVSWGFTPCGSAGAPSGVYKRVSAFNNWIAQHTGITN